jgi:hypothetical protein
MSDGCELGKGRIKRYMIVLLECCDTAVSYAVSTLGTSPVCLGMVVLQQRCACLSCFQRLDLL